MSTRAWSEKILINGIDRTADLIGDVMTDAEENGAGIALFSVALPGGALSLTDYRGKPVIVQFEERNPATGAVTATTTLFTGILSLPEYQPDTASIRANCTDNRNDKLASADQATIDALTAGALLSDDVQGVARDNYERAQFRLRTLRGSVDCDPSTGALVFTNWLPSSFFATYTDADAFDVDYDLRITPTDQLINKVEISIEYQYPKFWHREATTGWDLIATVCDYLDHPRTIPNKETIRQACESVPGWMLKSLALTDFYPSNPYTCGSAIRILVNNPINQLVRAAIATFVRRWIQMISKKITITVKCDASIAAHGERLVKRSLSFRTDPPTQDYEGPGANNKLSTDFLSKDGTPNNIGGVNRALDPPAGSVLNATANAYEVDGDEPARDALAVQTAATIAAVDIDQSQRSHEFEVELDLMPGLTVQKHIAVDIGGVLADGKVRRVQHHMKENGDCYTRATIALMLPDGFGSTDSIAYPPSSYSCGTGIEAPLLTTSGTVDSSDPTLGAFGRIEDIVIPDPGPNKWVSFEFDANTIRSLVRLRNTSFESPDLHDFNLAGAATMARGIFFGGATGSAGWRLRVAAVAGNQPMNYTISATSNDKPVFKSRSGSATISGEIFVVAENDFPLHPSISGFRYFDLVIDREIFQDPGGYTLFVQAFDGAGTAFPLPVDLYLCPDFSAPAGAYSAIDQGASVSNTSTGEIYIARVRFADSSFPLVRVQAFWENPFG